MKRFQVIRTHTSPYSAQDFLRKERAMVEEFPLLSYQEMSNFKDLKTILITNTHTDLKELPHELLKATCLIIHPNSGYDNFTQDLGLWKDIPVVIGHSIRAQAVAEYSLGALFEGLVELPQHLSWHQERTWNRTLLKGTEAWVFGYGHIGKIIADTLATLGMKITIVDPFISHCPHKLLSSWKEGDLTSARVVIAATGLNETSRELFNAEFFAHANPELLFINGARGKLVNEKALKEFLLSHPEAFAFLDVFEKEPFSEEWHGFPQVWKTSHIAGVEKELDQSMINFEEMVLKDFLDLDAHHFKKKYEKELLQNKWIKGVLI